MSYGNIYVAQIAMGANKRQTLKAIEEAEAYPGPSLIIAYTPCINHGISSGMKTMLSETQKQWNAAIGVCIVTIQHWKKRKNPMTMDYKKSISINSKTS